MDVNYNEKEKRNKIELNANKSVFRMGQLMALIDYQKTQS